MSMINGTNGASLIIEMQENSVASDRRAVDLRGIKIFEVREYRQGRLDYEIIILFAQPL